MENNNIIILQDIDRDGLIELCEKYDQYIEEICEDEENILNKNPVCISEYINNEFEEIARDHDYDDWLNAKTSETLDLFEIFLDKNRNIFDMNKENLKECENAAFIYGDQYYDLEKEMKKLLEEGI